jgi:hypothetical protein
MLLRGAGVAGAGLVGSAALPAEASAATGPQHGLLGAWRIVHTDNPPGDTSPVAAVVTFAAGGAFSGQDIAPVAPGYLGAWQAWGDRFRVTFWTGENGDQSTPAVTVRVRVRGTRHDDQVRGTYRVTVFAGATTQVVSRGSGTFHGSRLQA